MTDRPVDLVREFHRVYGVTNRESPQAQIPEAHLRRMLILEECKEFIEASYEDDIEHIAKELADIIYVVYGAALCYGINLDEVVAEVHRSNMSKLGLDGRPIYREDMKVLKGPNYREPKLKEILFKENNHVGN